MKIALLIIAICASVGSTRATSVSLQGEQYRRYMPIGREQDTIETKDSDKLALRYRLPTNLIPLNYVLHIKPRLFDDGSADALQVPGDVLITVRCVDSTNVITLHADALDMTVTGTTIKVTRKDPEQELSLSEVRQNATLQILEIEVVEGLEAGAEYNVFIEFKSKIARAEERMNGLYLSKYLNDEGETRLIATTQFSRTRTVRKVFPCFDEPNQKATFQINIGRAEEFRSLSCMPVTNGDEPEPISGEDGWFWDRYATTPVMPITVIAFIVSDFGFHTSTHNPDRPVSTWVPPPMLRDDGAVFSADTAAKALEFYENFLDIPYELPKLDSAGMPDFAAGAMENWGLNIYRTVYVLYYKDETTISAKYSSASVIGHEVAHQWFGNLVTHAWWNDWWITEGFASYFEYISTFNLYPEFDHFDRIVSDDVQPAMAFDIGPDSVPIHGMDSENFVENPSIINYQKGASLVRMMEAFLTPDVFKSALQFYLKKRRHTAVDQYALFDDITESLGENLPNGKSMREIMDSWTLQTVFPLIRVSKASATNIYLTQELFEAYNSDRKHEGSGLFHIPVSYVTAADSGFEGDNIAPKFWLDDETILKSENIVDTNQWLVVNADARGYYRVLYDAHFEGLLKTQLNDEHKLISRASRSQILDDYFASAFERYIPIGTALDMTTYLSEETDFVVWITVFRQLRKFAHLVLSTGAENIEPFQVYVRTLLQGAIQDLSLDQGADEDEGRTIFRVQVLDWACMLKDEQCLAHAKEQVETWRRTGINPIPVDLRGVLYCAAVASEDEEIWTHIAAQYSNTGIPELRNALACTSNPTKLNNLLDEAIRDGSVVAKADAVALIQRVAMNSAGRSLVVGLLDTKTNIIVDYIGNSDSISSIVLTLRDYITTDTERNQIQGLLTKYDASLSEAVKALLNQYIVTITSNIDWMSSLGVQMASWFKERAVIA